VFQKELYNFEGLYSLRLCICFDYWETGSGLESPEYGLGIRHANHVAPSILYPVLYRMFQKELYNFENFYKFIQRT
jgi:hypothetical protein